MESGGGRIVNMISFCTTCPLPTLAVYTSTKAALLRLSEGMRAELLKFGVDVVLFNPGDHPGSTPLCAYQASKVTDARVYFEFSVFLGVIGIGHQQMYDLERFYGTKVGFYKGTSYKLVQTSNFSLRLMPYI